MSAETITMYTIEHAHLKDHGTESMTKEDDETAGMHAFLSMLGTLSKFTDGIG